MEIVSKILKHWADDAFERHLVHPPSSILVRPCSSRAELLSAIRSDCNVLLANGAIPLDAEFFAGAGPLKRIICYDVGPLTWVDLTAATEKGVVIAHPRTQSQNAVAEYTLLLILSLSRHLVSTHRVGQNGWNKVERERLRGFELRGKTLGIIGMGRIGRLVAEKAIGLGMRVIAHSPRASRDDIPVPLLALPEVLRDADVISLHARSRTDNRELIGETELRQMRSTALLVNTARAALIDERALTRALREKWIAGAALDVLSQEPPDSDHPLLKMDNVIFTPHVAWNTAEVKALENEDVAEEIRRAVNNRDPLNCANPEVIGHVVGEERGHAKSVD
jgi:D-3-phosphoglycerate dehydrogenase / 2-oxoglutarate reductase